MQDDVPLSLQPEPHGRAVIVRLIGELDACSGQQLGARLERLLTAPFRRVVLDLSRARVRDAQAVRGLLCAHQRLELLGCQLILCEVPAVTLGILAMLGLSGHLAILDGRSAQALLEASPTESPGFDPGRGGYCC
jgi:anti-anti-sigma factor